MSYHSVTSRVHSRRLLDNNPVKNIYKQNKLACQTYISLFCIYFTKIKKHFKGDILLSVPPSGLHPAFQHPSCIHQELQGRCNTSQFIESTWRSCMSNWLFASTNWEVSDCHFGKFCCGCCAARRTHHATIELNVTYEGNSQVLIKHLQCFLVLSTRCIFQLQVPTDWRGMHR